MLIFTCTMIIAFTIIACTRGIIAQIRYSNKLRIERAEVNQTALMELLWEIHQEQFRARGIIQ